MTLEGYKARIKQIQDKATAEKNLIGRAFALENSPARIGDIVEWLGIKIRVEVIRWTYGPGDIPTCLYEGKLLTRKNKPLKRGESDFLYQDCVRIINGKPIDRGNKVC